MPSGFRGKLGDEESDADCADDRHQDHERTPRAWWRENVGVVANDELAEEQEVVNEADQIPERDCAEPRDDADHKGEEGENGEPDTVAFLRFARSGGRGWLSDQGRTSARRSAFGHRYGRVIRHVLLAQSLERGGLCWPPRLL